MYADMQKCHKAAHKNIKTGSGILTVDEAKILLKSHPEYILPQDSRMIHLLQNHKLWEFRDAEQTLESVLRILRRAAEVFLGNRFIARYCSKDCCLTRKTLPHSPWPRGRISSYRSDNIKFLLFIRSFGSETHLMHKLITHFILQCKYFFYNFLIRGNFTTGGHLIIISVPFTESDFQRRM